MKYGQIIIDFIIKLPYYEYLEKAFHFISEVMIKKMNFT